MVWVLLDGAQESRTRETKKKTTKNKKRIENEIRMFSDGQRRSQREEIIMFAKNYCWICFQGFTRALRFDRRQCPHDEQALESETMGQNRFFVWTRNVISCSTATGPVVIRLLLPFLSKIYEPIGHFSNKFRDKSMGFCKWFRMSEREKWSGTGVLMMIYSEFAWQMFCSGFRHDNRCR